MEITKEGRYRVRVTYRNAENVILSGKFRCFPDAEKHAFAVESVGYKDVVVIYEHVTTVTRVAKRIGAQK